MAGDQPGRRSYVQPGEHLALDWGATEEGPGFVNVSRAPRWAPTGPVVSLVLPGGGLLPLPGLVTADSPGRLTVARRDVSADVGVEILYAGIADALAAMGWKAQAEEPGVGIPFVRGADRLVVDRGTGIDATGEWLTAEVRIVSAPGPSAAASTGQRRGPPGGALPATTTPVLQVIAGVGEARIPLEVTKVKATEGLLCAKSSTAKLEELDAALRAGHWKADPTAGWYTYRHRTALLSLLGDQVCLLLDVPQDPAWDQLLEPGLVVITSDAAESAVLFRDTDTAQAERDHVVRELGVQGWAPALPREPDDVDGVKYWIQAFSRGDEEITVTLRVDPDQVSLTLTRRGPR